MRVLLAGRDGQIGRSLAPRLGGWADVVALGRADLDLRDTDAIFRAVREVRPDVIVNAAAYTTVDRAEAEEAAAREVNALAPACLADEARRAGALLVHFSTDYVFDGSKAAPYLESDVPAPLNAYGRTKLEGEQAVAASGARHVIFRTSWVYGPGGRNFVSAILGAARAGRELRVVADQRGAPTSSEALAAAVDRILKDRSLRERAHGLVHLSAAGETTWHGFACAILEAAGLGRPVVAISAAEYGAPARRPANSLLDNGRFATLFGERLADWRRQFAAILPSFL